MRNMMVALLLLSRRRIGYERQSSLRDRGERGGPDWCREYPSFGEAAAGQSESPASFRRQQSYQGWLRKITV
jgi:hypothetical protein